MNNLALLAFLHDIGKFAQRAEITLRNDFNKSDYNYNHSKYTAQVLSEFFNLNEIEIDYSAMHHNVNNSMDIEYKIIASADRLASGFEREEFEKYNSNSINEDFKTQRLKSIFNENKEYKIAKLSPNNIFSSDSKILDEYKILWQEFKEDLAKNPKIGNKSIDIENIDYLFKKYMSFIPSATTFKIGDFNPVKANIPLYDHLKTTAIFADVIEKMVKNGNENIVNFYFQKEKFIEENQDFLFISGDFFGIQDFIFDEVPTKYAAKTLRAKSAYVQLITKIIAFYIVEQLNLTNFSIISTNAGKFEILASNDNETKQKIYDIQEELNNFFLKEHFGVTGLGIAMTEASLEDFLLKRYKKIREKIILNLEEIKFKKFNLSNKSSVLEYDISITNQTLCPLCNKRKKEDEYCEICNKFVEIGKNLAKKKYLIITKGDGINIFKDYSIIFTNEVKRNNKMVAVYDISKDEEFSGYAKWEISSYVAMDEDILTLEELANNSDGKKALMALKGDVDKMGEFIFNSSVTNSFAKFNFFSRMVDYYFSVYVPYIMKDKNIYTIFAGGDDVFLVGAWNEVIELNEQIREEFLRFCEKEMTFSAGLVMSKANKPIKFIADSAEEFLEIAKIERDSICMFRDFVDKENKTYEDNYLVANFEDYIEERDYLLELLEEYELSTAELYKILDFCKMSKESKEDIRKTMWISKINYLFRDKEIDELKSVLINLIKNNPNIAKMVLFEHIYKRREG